MRKVLYITILHKININVNIYFSAVRSCVTTVLGIQQIVVRQNFYFSA